MNTNDTNYFEEKLRANIAVQQRDALDAGDDAIQIMITKKIIHTISHFEVVPVKPLRHDDIVYLVQFKAGLIFDLTLRVIKEQYRNKQQMILLVKAIINTYQDEDEKHQCIMALSQWDGISTLSWEKT